jgi:hypothetical protein
MFCNVNSLYKFVAVLIASLGAVSCVTETVNSPDSMRFSESAIIAVQDPNIFVTKGSTIAWLPEAVRFYKDKRLENAPIKALIEKDIVKNLLDKELILVESVNGARYAVAYTAALESSLDDSTIIRHFGLLPGNSQVPKTDSNIEKGTLIIYIFENKTHDIVWRSAAQVGVEFDMPVAERKARIESVLKEMFKTFTVTQ